MAIAVTKYRDDKPAEGVSMSRPLCPYPKRAHYKRRGRPHGGDEPLVRGGGGYPNPPPAAAHLR